MNDEENYLEKREFVCPECGQRSTWTIFERPEEGSIVDCGNCEWIGTFFWRTQQLFSSFQTQQYDTDVYFKMME